MARWTIRRGDGGVDVIHDEASLLDALDRIVAGGACSNFDLVAPSGDELTVVVLDEVAAASFTRADRQPPYLSALSHSPPAIDPEDLDDEGCVPFDLDGSYSPVPPEECITTAEMRRLCADFFRTGDLPVGWRWREH
ncbi:MAG: hypothetical protein M9894_17895 [Planctomycetes bacterium]|nr:hypothetical protein [Planctomycetota bacterium]